LRDYLNVLTSARTKLDQVMNIHYQDIKFLFKQISPQLVKIFENSLGKEEETAMKIKEVIIDIFGKLVNDDSIVETHKMVLEL
jgi:hypothetical protein